MFRMRYLLPGGICACLLAGHQAKSRNTGVALTEDRTRGWKTGVSDAVGNTPLIELKSLSAATGCTILAKAEHLNPSGSVKDRAALYLIKQAEADGSLKPGGTIIEATGGNTGISLALFARERGYKAIFTMPSNVSLEKIRTMQLLGAEVFVQPVVSFSEAQHYVHKAQSLAQKIPNAVYLNQFENSANGRAHFETTGPEIWAQTQGSVHALATAAGTGGTMGGVSRYLKERGTGVKVALIDPFGSSLFSYVKEKTMASEGSTTIEGIGIGRITANFAGAQVDTAFRVSDQEAVDMAYYLLQNEGLFIGPSAALNVAGAVKMARHMGPGKVIVTILCDGGDRYRSKLYDDEWLAANQLTRESQYTRGDITFVK